MLYNSNLKKITNTIKMRGEMNTGEKGFLSNKTDKSMRKTKWSWHQPPQTWPMDLTFHHMETLRQDTMKYIQASV